MSEKPAGNRAWMEKQGGQCGESTLTNADGLSVTVPGKVVTLREAEALVRAARSNDHAVVLCHGCFDIVHPGHLRHLRDAARHGQRLIVSITGDRSIDKGVGRPLIPEELRAESLAALDCVDWVTISPDPTAESMLGRLRPDVYIKGREYEDSNDERFRAEQAMVESYGGRVVFSSGDVVFSSTALINALEADTVPFQSSLRRLQHQHDFGPRTVDAVMRRFSGTRVVVVGETMIDTYVSCDRPVVASESPVLTLRPLGSKQFDGGAAVVARHLAAMGARPILVTALPRSTVGAAVRARLESEGVTVESIEVDQPLPEKQRFLVGSEKVMKLDLGEPLTLDSARQQDVIDTVVRVGATAASVVITDYGLGLFSSAMLKDLCHAVRPVVPSLVGDISGRRSNLLALREMDLLCPSEQELRDALHNFDDGLTSVAWALLHETKSRAALTTLGGDGLIAFERRHDALDEPMQWRQRLTAEHVPSFIPHAIDQLGCGDALLAAAALTLAARGPLVMAAILGSVAAAVQARRLGNAVISAADLRRGLDHLWTAQLTLEAEPAVPAVVTTGDQLHHSNA